MKKDSTAVEDHADKTDSANKTDVSTAKPSEGSKPTIKTEAPSVAEYAERIQRSLEKGLEGDLETADICADAQKRLDPKALTDLRKKMFKTKSEWSKYVAVGDKKKLKEPHVRALLPKGIERLYAVALLTDGQIDEAIKKKVLNPKATRGAMDAFRKGKQPESPTLRLVEIRVPRMCGDARRAELIATLKDFLREQTECDLVLPKSKEKAPAQKDSEASTA
jgi:hypothetical protein